MPRFWCDYCGTYLTHDSMSGRKQHNYGRQHQQAVRDYYSKFLKEHTQIPGHAMNFIRKPEEVIKLNRELEEKNAPPTPVSVHKYPKKYKDNRPTLVPGQIYREAHEAVAVIPTMHHGASNIATSNIMTSNTSIIPPSQVYPPPPVNMGHDQYHPYHGPPRGDLSGHLGGQHNINPGNHRPFSHLPPPGYHLPPPGITPSLNGYPNSHRPPPPTHMPYAPNSTNYMNPSQNMHNHSINHNSQPPQSYSHNPHNSVLPPPNMMEKTKPVLPPISGSFVQKTLPPPNSILPTTIHDSSVQIGDIPKRRSRFGTIGNTESPVTNLPNVQNSYSHSNQNYYNNGNTPHSLPPPSSFSHVMPPPLQKPHSQVSVPPLSSDTTQNQSDSGTTNNNNKVFINPGRMQQNNLYHL